MSPKEPSILTPQFSLRALLIFMLVAGPLCGWGWTRFQAWKEWQIQQQARQLQQKQYATAMAQLQVISLWNEQAIDDAQFARDGESRKLSVEAFRVRLLLETGEP